MHADAAHPVGDGGVIDYHRAWFQPHKRLDVPLDFCLLALEFSPSFLSLKNLIALTDSLVRWLRMESHE